MYNFFTAYYISFSNFFFFVYLSEWQVLVTPEGPCNRGWNKLKAEASCLALHMQY